MIKQFKNNPVRETGVINKGMFEQVKLLHGQDPRAAGELAISLMEMILTSDFSSDDFMVKFAMANHSIVAEKNREKYDKKVEASREARIENLKLVEIAEMLAAGMKQVEIAAKLGESKQVISNRVKTLRENYPEILEAAKESQSQKSQENQVNQTYDNVNDNDNDNVNDNVNVKKDSFAPSSQNCPRESLTADAVKSSLSAPRSQEELRSSWVDIAVQYVGA